MLKGEFHFTEHETIDFTEHKTIDFTRGQRPGISPEGNARGFHRGNAAISRKGIGQSERNKFVNYLPPSLDNPNFFTPP